VLSIAFVLGGTPAFADGYEPKIVPKCKLAGDFCGYTLGEWKLVLKVDAELVSARVQLKLQDQKVTLLEEQKKDLLRQAEAISASNDLLIASNDKLRTDLIALDKKYQDERVRPRWGSPLAWTAAAVSTSVLAGFLVSELID